MWYVCACDGWVFGKKPLWLARMGMQVISCMHLPHARGFFLSKRFLIGLGKINVH